MEKYVIAAYSKEFHDKQFVENEQGNITRNFDDALVVEDKDIAEDIIKVVAEINNYEYNFEVETIQ